MNFVVVVLLLAARTLTVAAVEGRLIILSVDLFHEQ